MDLGPLDIGQGEPETELALVLSSIVIFIALAYPNI